MTYETNIWIASGMTLVLFIYFIAIVIRMIRFESRYKEIQRQLDEAEETIRKLTIEIDDLEDKLDEERWS